MGKIADGDGKATHSMYTYDSDAMAAGTGEIRAWITVAGALEETGSKAEVFDYSPAGKSTAGLGIAYWLTEQEAAAAR